MRFNELFAPKEDLKSNIQYLKTSLEVQKKKFIDEETARQMELERLREENRRLSEVKPKQPTGREERESDRARERMQSLEAEVARLSEQARSYHDLAETNWALYEKAQSETRSMREVLSKIHDCMNTIDGIRYENVQYER